MITVSHTGEKLARNEESSSYLSATVRHVIIAATVYHVLIAGLGGRYLVNDPMGSCRRREMKPWLAGSRTRRCPVT